MEWIQKSFEAQKEGLETLGVDQQYAQRKSQ